MHAHIALAPHTQQRFQSRRFKPRLHPIVFALALDSLLWLAISTFFYFSWVSLVLLLSFRTNTLVYARRHVGTSWCAESGRAAGVCCGAGATQSSDTLCSLCHAGSYSAATG
jgi:hypothetical protein